MADFVSVEDAIGPWLNAQTGVRVVTETPADIPAQLIQLVRAGGVDEPYGIDVATVDITAFSGTGDPIADRAGAHALAEKVRTLIIEHLPRQSFAGLVVTRTQTLTAPAWRPYDDTNVRRFGAVYQLTLHRQ